MYFQRRHKYRGLAGLIWASGKCTTASCVHSRIERYADKISGTGTAWYWGRINAYNSLSAPSLSPKNHEGPGR